MIRRHHKYLHRVVGRAYRRAEAISDASTCPDSQLTPVQLRYWKCYYALRRAWENDPVPRGVLRQARELEFLSLNLFRPLHHAVQRERI